MKTISDLHYFFKPNIEKKNPMKTETKPNFDKLCLQGSQTRVRD